MATATTPPSLPTLLPPLLASLPSATVSPQPPTALLPLLAPILRQRVQILSAASEEPWLPLLCYRSNADKLATVVKSELLEPHPASGEVEIDWDNASIQYRRLDSETLQARVKLPDLGLQVGLVYCTGDKEGGGDGWRIGDVEVLDSEGTHEDSNLYHADILGAEAEFKKRDGTGITTGGQFKETSQDTAASSWQIIPPAEHEDNDDAYWAQYDTHSSAPTPATKRSPGPESMRAGSVAQGGSTEEAYYAQYEQVQPALDSEDPDEVAQNAAQYAEVESSLGQNHVARSLRANVESQANFTPLAQIHETKDVLGKEHNAQNGYPDPSETSALNQRLAHPRAASSSSSSSGSVVVARLEATAEQHDQSELGVRQHVATSIKSLYRLARATGIDRSEFSRLVGTELELLGVGEEED